MKSYRDYLDLKGLKPIVIERSEKRAGDKVIVSSCLPAITVKEEDLDLWRQYPKINVIAALRDRNS
jgi:hypothetical protein